MFIWYKIYRIRIVKEVIFVITSFNFEKYKNHLFTKNIINVIIDVNIFEKVKYMELYQIDNEIKQCNDCGNLVEKFNNDKTVSIGNNNDIVILGEAPANNGWRKSGLAWYDQNNNLIPSGVILQKLLKIIGYSLEDTYFLEAIKCYPKDRKYLYKCSNNCKKYLLEQLSIINPQLILTLGDISTRTLLDIKYSKFSKVVWQIFNYNGFDVIPIYHPSPISPLSYTGNIDIFENVIKEKVETLKIK